MYDKYKTCTRAFLSDIGLDGAKGGQVIQVGDNFEYRLFNQPEIDGEIVLELHPSTTPEPNWIALEPGDVAKELYQKFITDPENGYLYTIN